MTHQFASRTEIDSLSSSDKCTTQNSLTPLGHDTMGSNSPPDKSKVSENSPCPLMVNEAALASYTEPVNSNPVSLPVEPFKKTGPGLFLNWLKKRTTSSAEERMFVLTVDAFGFNSAIEIAAKLHWKYQRPLRELRAMIERGAI